MPKISPIKGHNDQSFQVQNIQTRNFSKFKDQAPEPIIRTKQTPFYDSVVPIYEVNYDPEFSKSPLASVQMSRRVKMSKYEPGIADLEEEFEERNHVTREVNFQSEQQKCDWKTILCWIGISLALIAFIVGLYFLVDAIMGRNTSKGTIDTSNQGGTYTSGITPIYVNSIPYESISPSASSSSVSSTPITHPQLPYSSATTYPSVLPSVSGPTVNQAKKPAAINYTPSTITPTPNQRPQIPTQRYIDPFQNSIQPLNAYAKFPS